MFKKKKKIDIKFSLKIVLLKKHIIFFIYFYYLNFSNKVKILILEEFIYIALFRLFYSDINSSKLELYQYNN